MVAWALSMALIDLPFSPWTHVTFKHFEQHQSSEGHDGQDPDRMGREKRAGAERCEGLWIESERPFLKHHYH
jgi:hypothetical protein